jgi:hypothetical protein
MTNDAAFFLFFLLLLVEVIITVVAALNVIKQLKDHIDYKFTCMKRDLQQIVETQFARGLVQIEDANRGFCKDVERKIASVNHIDSKAIYNALEKDHESFTSFANHLGKKHDELIFLIKPEDKPEEVMVSLDEVIETISKMKKEK